MASHRGQRLQAYGSFDECTAEAQRTTLAQACLVIVHLTAGTYGRMIYLTHLGRSADGALSQTVLDSMARLCLDVIEAMRGYVNTWCLRFWEDGWHPTCFVLLYTIRVVCKGRMTMEAIMFRRKHDWRFVDSEVLE